MATCEAKKTELGHQADGAVPERHGLLGEAISHDGGRQTPAARSEVSVGARA